MIAVAYAEQCTSTGAGAAASRLGGQGGVRSPGSQVPGGSAEKVLFITLHASLYSNAFLVGIAFAGFALPPTYPELNVLDLCNKV